MSLLDDLTHFSVHAVLYLPEAVVDSKLGSGNNYLEARVPSEMKHLQEVIKQCHRLKNSPELFPSVSIQKIFLVKAAQVSKVLKNLRNIVARENDIRKAEANLLVWTPSPANVAHTELPEFLPDRPDRPKPWNAWLDNSIKPIKGWIALQQRIPRVGDFMNLRKTILYDQKEIEFREVTTMP